MGFACRGSEGKHIPCDKYDNSVERCCFPVFGGLLGRAISPPGLAVVFPFSNGGCSNDSESSDSPF